VRIARRQATEAKSFGYHRATTLAAQANAAAILVVCVVITVEAIRRLADPAVVKGGPVIAVAVIAAFVNFGAAFLLHGDHHSGAAAGEPGQGDLPRDLNMRSALLHMLADGAVSVGVAIVGVVILATGGWYWLDPIVSLVISVVIGVQGWQLLRATADILLEGTPEGLDVAAMVNAMVAVDGVESVHDVHCWTLSTELRALSAHVVVGGQPTLEQAQAVGSRVRAAIGPAFRIAHATLELECQECAVAGQTCYLGEPGV
jgi:cobalt-zinc-cadmium efflux system protein